MASKPIVKLPRKTIDRWLEGVCIGIFPKPLRLGRKLRLWRAADIKALIEVVTP